MLTDFKTWNKQMLDTWVSDNIDGFTDEQVAYMAWKLGVISENKKREKEMLMHQGDNQSDSNGDSEDEYTPERE